MEESSVRGHLSGGGGTGNLQEELTKTHTKKGILSYTHAHTCTYTRTQLHLTLHISSHTPLKYT